MNATRTKMNGGPERVRSVFQVFILEAGTLEPIGQPDEDVLNAAVFARRMTIAFPGAEYQVRERLIYLN